MVDYLGYILQGLFTGIGFGTADYIVIRYLKPRYEKAHETITSTINKSEDVVSKVRDPQQIVNNMLGDKK